jgi:hypothetical protein
MLNKLHDKTFVAWNRLHIFICKQTSMSKYILLLGVRPCVDATELRSIYDYYFTVWNMGNIKYKKHCTLILRRLKNNVKVHFCQMHPNVKKIDF